MADPITRVWYQLRNEKGEELGAPAYIRLTAEIEIVHDLRKEVKKECPRHLADYDPIDLKVYANEAALKADIDSNTTLKGLDSREKLENLKDTEQNPLQIVVPDRVQSTTNGMTLRGATESEDKHVIEFWQNLGGVSHAKDMYHQNWLRLPHEVSWFGNTKSGSALLVRKAYETLWDQIRISTEDFIICGTPGVGKTYFSMYLLWVIQKTYPEATIVWERANLPCLAFCPDGTCLTFAPTDPIKADRYLAIKSNWYIADAVTPSFVVPARTVLVTSPRFERFKEFEKQDHTEIRWMPTWDLDELQSLHALAFPEMAWEDVMARTAFWGGVPRTVLVKARGESAKTDVLDGKFLGLSDLRKCFESEGKDLYPSAAVSGRILHLRTEDPYEDAVVRFASNKVADVLLRKFGAELKNDILRLFTAASDNTMFSGLRGAIFENLAHHRLRAGGTFQVRDLKTEAVESTTIPDSGEGHFFDTAGQPVPVTVQNIYNQPVISNLAAIDSLIPPHSLFQITVSISHPILVHGLKRFQSFLHDPVRLYFVVPANIFENYPRQVYHTSGKTVYRKRDRFVEDIQQFALRIDVSEDIFSNTYSWN
ncbi:hypothetical protein DFS34DRAFT_666843 [Phlyctochytrium arcticum]|nr:hypothetical protein DFS34DRAFT_666843 [Phlyctochytrium arcticum]